MMILVSYDVSTVTPEGRKRLRRVARACVDYGQRVQNSVFECNVDAALWETLKNRLLREINQDEDSLRFYYLGNKWRSKVEHFGAKTTIDPEGLLLF